jgi:amidase
MKKTHLLPLAAILISFCSFASTSAAAVSEADLRKLDLSEMRSGLDSGRFTSEELTKAFLNEIDRNNRKGNRINAVTTLNPKAIEMARNWDAQHKAGAESKSLGGIPFLVKDNYDTAELLTTGGSLALSENVPDKDAFIVKKILSQGAVLMGKTNMSELAASYGRLGYSSYGGQTLNPFNLLRDASGSSSGSAAAVAAGFAPFALGTDTSGSIRGPACVTGNVGLRPTLGVTSRSGIIPLSLTADTSGVITKNVSDQAIVLDVIVGQDPNDAATMESVASLPTGFAKGLVSGSLKGKRFLCVDNFDGGNADVDRIKAETIKLLEDEGATVVHRKLPDYYANLWGLVLGPVGTAEFRAQFDAYLASHPKAPHDSKAFMEKLAKLTDGGKKLINPGRYQGLEESIGTLDSDSPKYIAILTNLIPKLRTELSSIFKDGDYDAALFPTMSCPASVVYGKEDKSYECKSSDPYAVSYIASSTGFPELTVRAGTATGNIPVGISFLGLAGDDAKLLNLGRLFEIARQNELKGK